jgi:signal transduction histidine kinase
MAAGREPPDDALARLGERLPVSPLSVLGGFLAALVVVRTYADAAPLHVDALVAALPLSVSLGVVAADRYLVKDGVHVRDRMTVFTFALGGFLTAALITGLQLLVVTLRGPPVDESLFLTLVGGTIGVAAGTVAGVAEVRQREATRQAQRERERLEEFASVVSHDLRNPLEVSRGYLQKAFETGDPEYLVTVRDSLERMSDLIEESLALARQGQIVDETEPCELQAVADDAWATVDTGDATLVQDGDATLEADDSRFQELLENTFRNAVEHVGEDVTVTVGTTDDGFYVADDGPGIPADERDQVLERGHTTAADGSGLGLAIVQSIAEAHGWRVAVGESDAGGARFDFST